MLILFKESSLSQCLDCICSYCRPSISSLCGSIALNKTVASTVFKKKDGGTIGADKRCCANEHEWLQLSTELLRSWSMLRTAASAKQGHQV